MSSRQILVVDDEESIRYVLQNILEMNDCEVRQAESAEDAITLLQDWDPDVALLDIVLPGMNGLQLLNEVKHLSRDTEVLVMTSNSSAETALTAVRRGAFDYLKKPFDLAEVWSTVQRALEKRTLKLKNRALLRKQEQRNRELSAAIAFGDDDGAGDDFQSYGEILDEFLGVVTNELDVDHASLMLLNERTRVLQIASSLGLPDAEVAKARIRLGEGIAGTVARTGEPYVAPQNAEGEAGQTYPHLSDGFITAPIALSVAIKSEEQILGVVNLSPRRSGTPIGATDVSYLANLANQLAAAILKARSSQQLERAYASLKATQDQTLFSGRMQAVSQMAAGVTQDFNKVLSVILARTQLAINKLDGQQPDLAKVRSDLEQVMETALHGVESVKRIQEYTRMHKDVPDAPVDLNSVVKDAVEMARPKWERDGGGGGGGGGKAIDVQLELGEVPRVLGNRYELTQAVGKLIFNAVEAMSGGGVLTFRTCADAGSATLELRDSGEQLDRAARERLLDGASNGAEGEAGQATSVRRIVERHNGEVGVEAGESAGGTVKLRIPELPANFDAGVVRDDAHRGDFRSVRVLLVDEEEAVRQTFEEALSMGGHQVDATSGANKALAMLEPDKYDLLITDLSMTGMTGFELAGKAKGVDPQIQVVLLSGWEIEQEKVEQAGIDHILVKPCLVDDLLSAVQKAVRNDASV